MAPNAKRLVGPPGFWLDQAMDIKKAFCVAENSSTPILLYPEREDTLLGYKSQEETGNGLVLLDVILCLNLHLPDYISQIK